MSGFWLYVFFSSYCVSSDNILQVPGVGAKLRGSHFFLQNVLDMLHLIWLYQQVSVVNCGEVSSVPHELFSEETSEALDSLSFRMNLYGPSRARSRCRRICFAAESLSLVSAVPRAAMAEPTK